MLDKYALVMLCAFTLASMFHYGNATYSFGMTWSLYSHDQYAGVDMVGCSAPGGTLQVDRPGKNGNTCNPFTGDTKCSKRLPILCIANKKNANYPNTTATTKDWSRTHIATTLPIIGYTLGNPDIMTDYCIASFGVEWRAAEFHDGGGYTLSAFGSVRSDTRFWVYINDQPANCWD